MKSVKRVVFLLSFLIFPLLVQGAGNWVDLRDTTWNPDTTAGATNTITTAEQLAQLAWLTNQRSEYGRDVVFYITRTINLAGSEWTPIGTSGSSFTGSLIAAPGTLIRNLTINQPESNELGLIGAAWGSAVENLTLTGISITGNNYVGGITGSGGRLIRNCSVEGTIRGKECVGGISGTTGEIIQNCSARGDITGNKNVGGIIGLSGGGVFDCENAAAVTGVENVGGIAGECAGLGVVNSRSTGAITGTSTASLNIGGIAGIVSYGWIRNCRADGSVLGNENVGGISGCDGSIENSLVTAAVSARSGLVGAIVGRGSSGGSRLCYWLSTASVNQGLTAFGEEGSTPNEFPSFSDPLAIFEEPVFVAGEWVDTLLEALNHFVKENFMAESYPFAYFLHPWMEGGANDGFCPVFDTAFDPWLNYRDETFELAYGDTTFVRTAEELAQVVFIHYRDGYDVSRNHTICISESIDLSAHTWIPICANIGILGGENDYNSEFKFFQGTLTALPGVVVSGLTLKMNSAIQNNLGLVGLLGEGGVIRDLMLAHVEIEANQNAGAVAGAVQQGSIINCTVEGKISAVSRAGGVAGYFTNQYRMGEDKGEIHACRVNGEVHASASAAGGIVGHAVEGTLIRNCMVFGTVSAAEEGAGGILGDGSASYILNSRFSGSVSGRNYVGGILGKDDSGTIANCFAIASIDSNGDETGPVAGGWSSYNLNWNDCYWYDPYANPSDYTQDSYQIPFTEAPGKLVRSVQKYKRGAFLETATDSLLVLLNRFAAFPEVDFLSDVSGGTVEHVMPWTLEGSPDGYPVLMPLTSWASHRSQIDIYPWEGSTETNRITTVEEMAQVAFLSNAASEVLASGPTFIIDGELAFDEYEWEPIAGTVGTEFNATMIIDWGELIGIRVQNPQQDACGFIGTLGPRGKIEGINFANITIEGNEGVGGIVGVNRGGVIQSCRVEENKWMPDNTSSVKGSLNVGGVVGSNIGGQVIDCFVAGEVNGSAQVGGIAGYSESGLIKNTRAITTLAVSLMSGGGIAGESQEDRILDCFARTDITSASGSARWFGGITGFAQSSAILNCRADGTIPANRYSGGIVGQAGAGSFLENCASTVVLPQPSAANRSTVGAVAGDAQGIDVRYCYWLSTENANFGLPFLGTGEGTACVSFGDAPGSLHQPVAVGDVQTSDLLEALNGYVLTHLDKQFGMWKPEDRGNYPVPLEPFSWLYYRDTAWQPYLSPGATNRITTAEALAQLAWCSNLPQGVGSDAVFTIAASIDLSAHEWEPIGSKPDRPFTAVLTAEPGTVLTGLTVNAGVDLPCGFVGSLAAPGKLDSLTIQRAAVTGFSSVGGLVGSIRNGEIQNCAVDGTVTGESDVGGHCRYGFSKPDSELPNLRRPLHTKQPNRNAPRRYSGIGRLRNRSA